MAWYGITHPGARIAVVAPTYADARDTCIEGESGLVSVLPYECLKTWNRSLGELVLWNDARYKLFSAEEPDRLRGPQHSRAWCDEVAAWQYPETWDQLLFGLRLGTDPRVVATTTPKPVPLIRELIKNKRVLLTTGRTDENAANLAPAALTQLRERYEGTRLGRQELNAEILEEADGALWTRGLIRYRENLRAHIRRVVAIDPPASSSGESALAGIVGAGLASDGTLDVLADRSGRKTPGEWASTALALYDELQADLIVAEGNQGGEMVAHTIHTIRPGVKVKTVHASRSKQARAEPIAALYEQGKVYHLGGFPDLEDEMCTWEPLAGLPSPDRLDALVWAITELAVGAGTPVFDTPVRELMVGAVRRTG